MGWSIWQIINISIETCQPGIACDLLLNYMPEMFCVSEILFFRIDDQFLIKIADFGLSEDVFGKDYFQQDSSSEVKLPVKWMAPESLSDGYFSEKSDIVCTGVHHEPNHSLLVFSLSPQWSYGVTIWEIFSGGKSPYPETDPVSLVRRLDQGYRMPQPYNPACSEEM